MFLKYAFLADSVSFDAAGKLSAMGIFDVIYTRQFPTLHRDMALVIVVEGDISEKGDHKLEVELRDDKSNKLAGFDQSIALSPTRLTKTTFRAQLITKLQDMPFPSPGQYEFVFFINGRFLGRVVFALQKMQIKSSPGET